MAYLQSNLEKFETRIGITIGFMEDLKYIDMKIEPSCRLIQLPIS